MLKKTGIAALLALICCAFGVAAQVQMQTLNIVLDASEGAQAETYLTVKKPSDIVRVDWVQMGNVGTPDSAYIYYSRSPNGGDVTKYTRVDSMQTNNKPDSINSSMQKRIIRFSPEDNKIGAGVYYCIVAFTNKNGVTHYSNYFELKVASPNPPMLISPKGVAGGTKPIDELTPSFSWSPVSGVPYYHVILSDEPLPIMDAMGEGGKKDEGGKNPLLLDLSIVWQAITPNTRITYGAPDPSNTITASPPPLSPGKEYSWLVLNNYGNHMAFSDGNAFDIPGTFRINGQKLKEPQVVSPVGGITVSGDNINFRWTNLDTANSYLVNVFASTTPDQLGMVDNLNDAEVKASLLVWETTVSRGTGDTLSVDLLNASGTLTGGDYVWRVYALDSRGAATTGDASKGIFTYNTGVKLDTLTINTIETIGNIPSGVGYVELRSEVISGPMQAPLAFYTGADGSSKRPFPAGTYRITAVKDGYNIQTVTFTLQKDTTVNIYMRRPDAVIYGRVVTGTDSASVNLAKVTAVSEWGDTVSAMTNGSGNFTLNCGAADWTVTIEKAGYRISRPRTITLKLGDNINFGTTPLEKNPNTLSGTVRNSSGTPVIGAKVRVLRDGVLIEELASTPQNGAYSFSLASGTYTLTAEKPGFVMYSGTVNLTGSRNQDITIAQNAALINGTVFGRSWKPNSEFGVVVYVEVFAPIPNAKVTFTNGANTSNTYTVTSDATFGKFSLSVLGGNTYTVRSEAGGFVRIAGRTDKSVATTAGQTITFNDTLQALAMISGNVTGSTRADVDIIVYDTSANRVAASAKSSNDGSFEIRNIPDGNYIINAGKSGYYLLKDDNFENLKVTDGKPEPSKYELTMLGGNRKITWNVIGGYEGKGSIKVTSPLIKAIPFNNAGGANRVTAVLDSIGPGDYVMEAVAESNPALLQLSYLKFTVGDAEDAIQDVRFPLSRKSAESVGGVVTIKAAWADSWSLDIKKSELFYRSEGSAQYSVQPSQPEEQFSFAVTPNKDGCDLQYYFRIELENGDVYGSPKQIFTFYVEPNDKVISRIDVDPGSSGETLYLPSSYTAKFTFNAYYSDMFEEFKNEVGSVRWDAPGASLSSTRGYTTTLTTGAGVANIKLTATFTPSSPYKLKSGKTSETVEIPIRVTGAALKSLTVVRNGGQGPVSNTEETSFRVQAEDDSGKAVSVSPSWSIMPETAGRMGGDGLFTPRSDFFGVVHVYAEAGVLRAEYQEAGEELPGLSVSYLIGSKKGTASTYRGLRFAFPDNSVPAGESVELSAVIHSTNDKNYKNSVRKGSGGFRMADSLAYDIKFSSAEKIDSAVSVIIDVPEHLRKDAAGSPGNFKVAWWSDDLSWVTLPTSEVVSGGAAVAAKLNNSDSVSNSAALSKKQGKASQKAEVAAAASKLYASARYALVVQSTGLSVDLAVSPNPFSPYIRPFREYGKDYTSRAAVPAGTCFRVSVEAPEYFVRSLKVHIYNATGKRVWAVEKFNAEVGENRIWWDGRTTSREEIWSEGFLEQNKDRGRMCRNGRYFVTVVITDMEGRQRRVMKPLVLMK